MQAAIAALHSAAPTASETDWQQIVQLYDVLAQMVPTPVVALNRAVAISFADDPEVALSLLDDLASELPGFGPLHAARADVLRRLDRPVEAAAAYREALAVTANPGEAAFLAGRLAELSADPRSR